MEVYNFSKKDSKLYDEFRKLQYLCFVKEQRWEIPSNHKEEITNESESDEVANFTLFKIDNEFIGGGKSLIYSNNFMPHKDLYLNIFKCDYFNSNLGNIAVINGLCFKSTFREDKSGIKVEERRKRLFRRLMLEVINELNKRNIEIVLFSTGIQTVAISCYKLGFKLVMKPISYNGPISKICSMAAHVPSILKNNLDAHNELILNERSEVFNRELNNLPITKQVNLIQLFVKELELVKSLVK